MAIIFIYSLIAFGDYLWDLKPNSYCDSPRSASFLPYMAAFYLSYLLLYYFSPISIWDNPRKYRLLEIKRNKESRSRSRRRSIRRKGYKERMQSSLNNSECN